VTRARLVAPGVEGSTRLVRGTAARALLGEARDARLLVLGSRGRSGLRAVLSGSVAGPVSRHSPCPIVVIRPFTNRPADRVSLRSAPRVVVGVGPTSGAAAIGFAFHAASQRGIPLTVLSAWSPDTAADIETIPGPPHIAGAAADRAVQQTLAPWREEFPTVPVITTLVCADPASALIAESSGTALLVVGSSSRGHLRGLLCGSVSRTVLCDAGCPVAIVGPGRTNAGRTTAAQTRAEHRAVSSSGSTDRPRRQVFWIRRASQ
jgi:nucleotide-binding universal stress UspA family protein